MRTHTFFLQRLLCFCIFFFLLHSLAKAQTDSVYTGNPTRRDSVRPKKNFEPGDFLKEKVTYGGNFQLQFGTYTFVYLSPTIGYMPIEKLTLGVGLIYNYISFNYGSYGTYSESIYGTHTFARYFVTQGVFLQAQYDRLFQPNVYSVRAGEKTWVEYALVGVGFRQPIGDKAALSTSILYNLTPNDLSIYYPSRFVIQFGFMGRF